MVLEIYPSTVDVNQIKLTDNLMTGILSCRFIENMGLYEGK